MNRVPRQPRPWTKLLLTAVAALASGQTPQAAARPEFEVASVKLNPSGNGGFGIRTLPGGRLVATNISLKRLIAVAYSLTDYQIFGEASVIETPRYNVDARAGGPADLAALRLMTQSLLDDRFKLKFHRETRELPIYSLIMTKADPGPGLVEVHQTDCSSAVTPQDTPVNGARPATPCGTVSPTRGRDSRASWTHLSARGSSFQHAGAHGGR